MTEQGNYRINYEPLFGPLQLIDVGEAIKRADHPWYNQTLIEVGGVLLRLGVFAGGEYHWHKHQEQDEFFYVIGGRLRIELEDRPGGTGSRYGLLGAARDAAPSGGAGADAGADDRGIRSRSHRRLTGRGQARQPDPELISALKTVGSMPITIRGAQIWRKYDLRGKDRSPYDLGR